MLPGTSANVNDNIRNSYTAALPAPSSPASSAFASAFAVCDERAAWAARADELAAWACRRLVNRTDAWGEYRPDEEVGREYARDDGTKGRLGPQTTAKGRLTPVRLARHFEAHGRADVIGLHLADVDNLSKGGGLDIDHHGPDSTPPGLNLDAALHWYAALAARGFAPLLIDSNGSGGFHLRVLLADPIDAGRVFQLFRDLTADHHRLGFAKAPEQFPKQPDVRRCGKKLGNWLRLPGRHHRRDFWSRVWDGRRWLAGSAAVDLLLSLPGDPPVLAPNAPPPPTPARPYRPRRMEDAGGLSARIAAYLRRLPNLGAGQGRDDVAFRFAAFLVRDLALDDAVALGWLERWDGGNSPPKGRDCLDEIVKNARAYGQRAVGCGVEPTAAGPRVLPAARPGYYLLRATTEVW